VTAFLNHFAFEFRTGLREPAAMLMYYLFPLGFYVLMGVVMVPLNPDFVDRLIPAMILVAIMAGTLLGLPNQLIDARTAGVYRSFKVNGVPALSILAAPMLAAGFHGLVASAVIAVTAGPLFGATVPQSWVSLALLTVLSAFTFGATAALIGVVSNSTQSSVLLSQLVFLPSMLIGGLMIDLAALPEGVGAVARLLPTSSAVQAFIGHAYQEATVIDPTLAVAVLAGGGLVALALAIGLFSWDPDSQTRRLNPTLALLAIAPYLVGLLVAIA
jgi:ABC-2 type transport system permease protein